MQLRSEGKSAEANIVKQVIVKTDSSTSILDKKVNDASSSQKNINIIPYTPREALAFMLDTDMSKASYHLTRTQAKLRGVDLYPSYDRVKEAKRECYPSSDFITITDTKSEIKLQALLDHTVNRIIEMQKDVLLSLRPNLWSKLILIKWGCDGSSGHSMYKQKSDNEELLTDRNLFLTCLVPLQLFVESNNSKTIVWQNSRPSSTRFCRPVKLQFIKETTEVILQEKQYMDQQIQALQPTIVTGFTEIVSIQHKLCMTMLDGKTCHAITHTASSQTCNMCGVTPKNINNIDKVLQRDVDMNVSDYGLSTLHAYIRFFEWFLHVASKLDVKVWCKTKNFKDQIEARESILQTDFRSKMGLLIGVVLQGKGSTHDGNTARKFFENVTLSAEITGISETLISRCATILKVLSCGFAVNVDAFRTYALETARLYVSMYSWYSMPTAVHKILIHGADVIAVALLPIGMLSEEAQEARNKDFRRYREKRCRKTSRQNNNQDLINIFLTSSDPIISSMRSVLPKKCKSFNTEVLQLLEVPEAVMAE